MSQPQLSVVIACWEGFAGLEATLLALGNAAPRGVEVIVVANHDLAVWPDRYPWVRFLRLQDESMTPHLWAAGMDIAAGSIVAISTSHMLPAVNYVEAILSSFRGREVGGVGGRINPPARGGRVAWAVYLLRYSQYVGLAEQSSVEDFAGDNGSYTSSTLARYQNQIRERGFWEHELHQQMRRDGIVLAYDPTIEVRQIVPFGFFSFVSQRFSHGWRYGCELTRGRTWPIRTIFAGRATLVPALLVFRVARHVVASGRYGGQFLVALPLLIVFSMAWGLGEGGGCLDGRLPR